MRKQILKAIYLLFAIMIIASISFHHAKRTKPLLLLQLLCLILLLQQQLLWTILWKVLQPVNIKKDQRLHCKLPLPRFKPFWLILHLHRSLSIMYCNLSAAVALFKTKTIVPIAQANLVAQWTFSEGTGTTVTDASSNHLVGTFYGRSYSYSWRGPLPTWCPDRLRSCKSGASFSLMEVTLKFHNNSILAPTQWQFHCVSGWQLICRLTTWFRKGLVEGYKLICNCYQTVLHILQWKPTLWPGLESNGITDITGIHLVVTLTAGVDPLWWTEYWFIPGTMSQEVLYPNRKPMLLGRTTQYSCECFTQLMILPNGVVGTFRVRWINKDFTNIALSATQ